jgi:hypothetical protein
MKLDLACLSAGQAPRSIPLVPREEPWRLAPVAIFCGAEGAPPNVSANPSGPEGRGLRKQAECLEGLIGFSA